MADLKLFGKVVYIGQVENGISKNGNEWKKMYYIVEETTTQYPKRAMFALFNGRVDDAIKMLAIGAEVTTSFDISAREWNGKYYNDVTAWRIELGDTTKPLPPTDLPSFDVSAPQDKNVKDTLDGFLAQPF